MSTGPGKAAASTNPTAPATGGTPPDGSTVSALIRYFPGPAARGRTTDLATDALREAILDGALPPSTWLREDELAEILGISRTPVREALRRLADEGLAVKTVHQGTVVAPLSLEDILALYIVREHLESLATRLATTRRPPGLVDRLEALQAEMHVNAGDAKRLVQQNLEFHRTLREAAGNSYLERFLGQVEHAVRRLPGSTYAQPGRTEEMLVEHRAIIDAVMTGDPESAARAAQAHMRRAREVRLSVLLGT